MFATKWRTSKWLSSNLVGFSIASLFSDCSHEMIPLLLPTFLTSLAGAAQAPFILGIVSSVSTAAMSISAFFSGIVTDRSSHKKALIEFGYGIEGLCAGLLGFVTNWVQVLITLTLAWIGRGIIGSARSAAIANSTDPAYYGRAFGFRQAMDTIGSILGPLIVFTLSSWPIRSLFFITFIPAAAAFLAIVFLTSEPSTTKTAPLPQQESPLLSREFKLFLGALLIFALGNFSKTLLVLRTQNLLTPVYGPLQAFSSTTLLYSFRNIIQALATYGMGALSDRIGRKNLLAGAGFFCFGIVSLLLLYESADYLYLTLIFFLSGISAGTTTSLEKSFAADLLPLKTRGTGYGSLTGVQSIGALISSIVTGYLWSSFSPQVAFIYAASLSFCSALMLFFSKEPSNSTALD